MLGFDKILVHNYDSTDDTKCILDAYAKEGIVVRVPEDIELGDTFKPVQRRALSYCAKYLSKQEENADAPTHTWMITHDIDEFLWFNQTDGIGSLKDAANRLIQENGNEIESLPVPRLFFGSSGKDHYEPELVIDRFTHRFDYNACPQDASAEKSPRLFADQPKLRSYCDQSRMTKVSSYDDVKTMSLVSALALECFNERDPATGDPIDGCVGPHRHFLKDLNGSAIRMNVTEKGILDDPRCLDLHKVGPSIAIMHYRTKSREEFYARMCSSVYKKKYSTCKTCTAETYFDLTETFGNNMRDDRMAPFSAQLKAHMAKADIGADCDAQPIKQSMEYYEKCLGITSSGKLQAQKS